MTIRTPSQAIDALGGTAAVAAWLNEIPHTVSGWRKRGIARGYHIHFYVTLQRRKYSVLPSTLGLASWDELVMPRMKGNGRARRAA